ncbi:MAG: hypothetical protein WAV98_03115 [Minisyncoccia bacterium]
MFENIFTTKQEKPLETGAENIREDFEKKEEAILKEGTGFLEKAEPEKFKKKSANLLLALSLFASASTAFAGEQNTEKDLPAMGEEQILKKIEKDGLKNQTADFNWKKIVEKIEISAGVTAENTKKYSTESIDSRGFNAVDNSTFYEGFDRGRWEGNYLSTPENNATRALYSAVNNSQNSKEFFSNFASETKGLQDKQKLLAVQKLGEYLGYAYDEDMERSDTHITVSNDAMFNAVKDKIGWKYQHLTAGICGNIHTYIREAAQSAGMEAFMQSGSTSWGGGHVWTGLVVENDSKKEIVFLDYGTLIPTGTLNYKDALGIAEKYHRSVSVFSNYVGDEHGVLFPVLSRASEVLKQAAGIEDPMIGLEKNLESGEQVMEGSKFEVRLSPETSTIRLGSDAIGLTFFNFKDAHQNSYQSLKEVNAWRGNVGVYGKKGGIGASATVINMNIKDLDKRWGDTKETAVDELVTSLFASYVDNNQFTKKEYGQFKMNWGATLNAAMSTPLGSREILGTSYRGAEMVGAIGARLIYLDPNNVGKFYIDASQGHRLQGNDFQEQKAFIKEVSNRIALGAEVNVIQGNVLGLEIGDKKSDWGDTINFKAGVSKGNSKISFSYEKAKSENETFIPSSQKLEIEVANQISPKWEVDFVLSNKSEHYKGGTDFNGGNNDIFKAEVKAKMLLW